MWRRYNVGANSPSDFGSYFSWGNTEGHLEGSGYDFSQETYEETPASSISENLTLNNDMAYSNLGQPWRMPVKEDFKELADNCSAIWTTMNGVRGKLFTSLINGNVIFFPATGYYENTNHVNRGVVGRYWSSTYVSAQNANIMSFDSSAIYPTVVGLRQDGFCVRAVQPGTPNRSIIPPTPEDEPKDEETPTTEEPKDKDER